MGQAGGLNDLAIETHLLREFGVLPLTVLSQPASNLRDFDGVLLARVEHVGFAGPHDLCNPGQPPKRGRVKNAIPVALKSVALVIDANAMPSPSPLVLILGHSSTKLGKRAYAAAFARGYSFRAGPSSRVPLSRAH
jgi:hypothetical protein